MGQRGCDSRLGACGLALLGLIGISASLVPLASTAQERPGLVVERLRAPRAPEVDVGDRIMTIVRVDPRRYTFRFLLGSRDGGSRTLPAWVRDYDLSGGINAGMFLPNERPCGFVEENDVVLSNRRVSWFEGTLGFEPVRPTDGLVGVGGRGCGGDLEAMRQRYRSVLQSNRMLVDCHGRAQENWRTKRYSAAAIGVDRDGWAVLVHVRTPYRMQVLARMLAADELGIRGLVYMEGGPEASLIARGEGVDVREIGSYEDGFHPMDTNHAFWRIPNVIGFSRR